ncbi:hypothetical protein QWI17_23220 [Gilvimarinus sp. SDUM040013]|uniref:Uncharacterized protein n=1 Tax=Gilvimarinus gilvus TaxID=3058038 RepID=A0ABU4S051_9GAMM|nr:hypothetical protein [Gilvimarinus sp. SDUM040013]MDO3388777.1 hypothetical protein [Gilvimarinus sp. SDUM040013]MDX6850530.1 hypothetical protein [Gilvimarinus sp. SDUM040013]
MVYLGPITRLSPVSKPKPATGYEPDKDLVIDKRLPEHVSPKLERRRSDRRKNAKNAVLDSRSGRDRRRNKRSSIDLEV